MESIDLLIKDVSFPSLPITEPATAKENLKQRQAKRNAEEIERIDEENKLGAYRNFLEDFNRINR